MSNTPPLSWKVSSFDQVFSEIKNGCSIDQNTSGDGIPVTRIETISQEKIDYSKVGWVKTTDDIDRFQIEKHDILLSHINSLKHIGKTAIKEDDRRLYHGMNLLRLKVCKSSFYPVYIHNLLSWEVVREEMRRKAKQAINQASLNVQDIKSLTYALPPLPEQQKIATILSSVDDVIEKTRAQIDKLKDLKTGMMQELLTKGIGHTEFKDSRGGRIPKGWDVGTLDSFCVSVLDGDRGKEYPKEKDFHSFEYCLFLSAKNVTKKGFAFSERSFITKEKDGLLRKGKLTRGDIVITTRGTVGNIAFYDNEVAFDNIRINSGMAIIRNSSTVLDSQFLHLLMNSPMVSEQVELLAFGSAQPQLTIGIIKNLDVPKPRLEEQQAITSAVTAMATKLQLVNKKLNLLLSTKKALMQDLLTGKVRVNLTDKESAVV